MKLYAPAYQDVDEPTGWEPHDNRLYVDRAEAAAALEKLIEQSAEGWVRTFSSRGSRLTGEQKAARAREYAQEEWSLQEYDVVPPRKRHPWAES